LGERAARNTAPVDPAIRTTHMSHGTFECVLFLHSPARARDFGGEGLAAQMMVHGQTDPPLGLERVGAACHL
jgi:hypothetical protein